MKKYLLLIVFLLVAGALPAQTDTLKIGQTIFITQKQVLPNEWSTTDTVLELYRLEQGHSKQLLQFYLYKDEGGDCNNLFWITGTMKIQQDSLVFLTHYLQDRNDPIPEWNKRIYKVARNGLVTLIFDRYKYRNDKAWKKRDQLRF